MKNRLYLHAGSPVSAILPFMLRTADGLFALAVAVIFVLWGAVGLIHPPLADGVVEPARLLAASVLMLLFFLRNRYDTHNDDREQAVVSALCTACFACTPFYRQITELF